MTNHRDVLIVGAGLSGIGAAYRLQEMAPQKTYAVLEGRESIGGTWDLFRYPGIRSDSDMYTLSFPFKPWTHHQAIAGGADIRQYLVETAQEFGIDKQINYGRKVTAASWDTDSALWTVTTTLTDGSHEVWTTNFLYLCSGYYSYDQGYTPDFPGIEKFQGTIVHPQFWPEDLDYTGKKVVVIGSGATAVTLLPSMADQTEHITMLQRSPTYIVAQPGTDPFANFFYRTKLMPKKAVHWFARKRYAIMTVGSYLLCRAFPKTSRKLLTGLAAASTPKDFDRKHITPKYAPWDQRLCVIPGGDLWRSIREGKASIVTDHIREFTPTGIALESGENLDADIIVTATGLTLVALGDIALDVDGRKINPHELFNYKGLMFNGLPNLAWVIGYTNASWTLRANLSWKYVADYLNYLDKNGYDYGMPDPIGQPGTATPVLDLDSGYIQRASELLPQSGATKPWKVRQNWFLDTWDAQHTDIEEAMVFGNATASRESVEKESPDVLAS